MFVVASRMSDTKYWAGVLSAVGVLTVFVASVAAGQARTACIHYQGQVLCGPVVESSPPPFNPPRQQCQTALGRTVCGYQCATGGGNVQCTNTPLGACVAAYGRVTCWDPPQSTVYRFPNASPAQCVSNYGVTACGWSCVANYGRIRCADTPDGVCVARSGNIVCSGD